jgi:hypothetical protein
MHVSNVSSAFRRILQALNLDVSKLDRDAAHGMCVGSERGAGDVWVAWAPCGRTKNKDHVPSGCCTWDVREMNQHRPRTV